MRSYILTESERAKVQTYIEGNRDRDSSIRQLMTRSRENFQRLEQDLQLIHNLLNKESSDGSEQVSVSVARIQALREEMQG